MIEDIKTSGDYNSRLSALQTYNAENRWKKMELLFIRQVTHQRGILPGLFEHALYRNVLVLGAVDLSVLVRFDT